MSVDCVFCEIIAGRAPALIMREWPDAIAIRPRDPVNSGHALVIPRRHVVDAYSDQELFGAVMARAAGLSGDLFSECNLISSVGAAATQTVFHLHVHIVPRWAGDGLALPWTGQKQSEAE